MKHVIAAMVIASALGAWSADAIAQDKHATGTPPRATVRIDDQTPMPFAETSTPNPTPLEPTDPANPAYVRARMYGQFGYLDPEGGFHPGAHLRYSVYLRSLIPELFEDEYYYDGMTDENGIFDFYAEYTPMYRNFLQEPPYLCALYIVVETATKHADWFPANPGWTTVKDITYGGAGTYKFTMTGIENESQTLVLFGTAVPDEEIGHGAVHITSQLNRALPLMYEQWSTYASPWDIDFSELVNLDVIFPHDGPPAGSYAFNEYSNLDNLFVSAESAWRDDHLFRLLGHAWHRNLSGPPTHNLCDGTCDSEITGCSFCIWCAESGPTAWNEGFALYCADLVTGWMQELDDMPTLQTHGFESLRGCGPFYMGPSGTPGYTAALLHDLADLPDVTDDHPQYPGLVDAVGGLGDEMMSVIDIHEPTSASELLSILIAEQPQLAAELWETGANCGFNLDTTAPGLVTNLTSPSHSVGVGSDDATVDLTWDSPGDDLSGIAGYGLSWATITALPPEVITITGDVTSAASPILPPGNWYLNLRSVDRAGNWSNSFRAIGPFPIQVPPTLDLEYRVSPTWDDLSFPSQGEDNSFTEAHLTPVLVGDIATNHYNLYAWNAGPDDAEATAHIHAVVDGVVVTANSTIAQWAATVVTRPYDSRNYFVSGGRHNFATILDALNNVTETDETNNVNGRQYVWTGAPLTVGVPVQRAAPPFLEAGGDLVPSAIWFVCDGLSFQSTGWWSAVTVRGLSDVSSYAARLHVGSTGSLDGFAANLAFSTRPQGTLNGVLVNRNTMGEVDWDVGVLNGVEGGPDYEAVLVNSVALAFGDSLDATMLANERLLLRELYVTASDTGRIEILVDAGPGNAGLGVNWLDRTFQTGTLLDGTAVKLTDSDGQAQIEVHAPDVGYYCLVIYRDDLDVTAPLAIGVESGPARPDVAALQPAGWDAPLVPRPLNDGTNVSVVFPDTLHGNQPNTWFNYTSGNLGFSDAHNSMLRVEVDGESVRSFNYELLWPGVVFDVNHQNPFTISGGRHTAVLRTDADGNVDETNETNNNYGRSWVWSPLEMPVGTTLTRPTPPDPIAGMDIAGLGWYNCDGLRQMPPSGYWTAVAILPTDLLANPDLRLHQPAAGAQDGFAANLAVSTWGAGESDFVLTNHNYTEKEAFDVGVVRGPAILTADYQVEVAESQLLNNTDATWGPYTMGANEIIDLYEFSLAPGFYHIVLENVSGGVDWGVSLHRQDRIHQGKSSVIEGGAKWLRGPGENEYLDVVVPDLAFGCLAVWKRGTDDLNESGSYRIRFQSGLSGVEDQTVPALTRLVGAVPNPFNPSTTVSYELARSGRVRLTVYDLTGARIADLVDAVEEPGRHEMVWSGKDAAGRGVASGVYMARLTLDGRSAGVTKLVLMK